MKIMCTAIRHIVEKTFNVNEGHNYNLMEHCQTLREYSQFVAQVRQNKSTMDLNTAINHAVDDCIKNNILFLLAFANAYNIFLIK